MGIAVVLTGLVVLIVLIEGSELLQPLVGVHGIEIHDYVSSRFNTILRFDEQMLVTLNLWGTSVARAPMLHLRRAGDGGLFDQFAEHFESIWQGASEPDTPEADVAEP